MIRSVFRMGFLAVVTLALSLLGSKAWAQGATSQTLSGTVMDASGAVLPGADVAAKHTGTGVVTNAVTNGEGVFSMPSLALGSYTVTVTLQGFKTVVIQNVVLTSAAPASVKAAMEVGGVTEQVTVASTSEIVQTQSSTVSSTITAAQITKLPLTSRSAMDFVNFLPGVNTANGNRQASINGLPRGTINITLDGVNIQDNTLRTTDGFFAIVSPRIDAIEEVSVSTAAQGAADAGQGAAQVKFVTRSGTNSFTGSGYYYRRRDSYNANTWFNNRNGVAKAALKQDQGGVSTGGPIFIPGLYDGHNKAFFFVNYEQVNQPSQTTRNNRIVLNPSAQAGNYCYGPCVNVLQLAASKGVSATADPTVTKLLQDIRNSVNGGSLSDVDPNLQRFAFNVPVQSQRWYPTFRLDYNLTNKHRASFSYNYQKFTDYPDTLNSREYSFPGFPVAAGQSSVRLGWAGSVRSTLRGNLVNEARVGYSGAPVQFFSELNLGMYTGPLANQGGFQLNFPAVGTGLTNPSANAAPQSRNANSLLFEDSINWLKGSHSLTLGGSFTQYDIWAKNSSLLPTVNLGSAAGLLNGDPALALFTPANFPGASATQLTAAQNLYALLTGDVTSTSADARLDEATGKYIYEGTGTQRGRQREFGFYSQDAWRLKTNMTLNLGLRYDVQQPFIPLNSLYSQATVAQVCGVSGAANDHACNLFQPGNMPGNHPQYTQYQSGAKAHNTDWNNFSPSAGFAWTPTTRPSWAAPLMGREGDFVVRAGYNRAYSRPGLNDYIGRLGANPGIQIDASRSTSLGNFGTVPLFFSDTSRLQQPAIPDSPSYPLSPVISNSINTFAPNLQVPSTDSFTGGVQRSLGKDMAVEVRYVHTQSRDNWANLNYNEINIVENGFLKEFRQAQANLQANLAASGLASFAYTGAPGTAPLPILLAYFNGLPSSAANTPGNYAGGNWTNSSFLGFLAAMNPNPFGFASNGSSGLQGNATFRANALAAGLPANFFEVNPETLGTNGNNGAVITSNLNKTHYNALQLELRRRYAQGLQFNASYTYGHEYDTQFFTFRRGLAYLRPNGNSGDIPHSFKSAVTYDLPFGRGRHWGANVDGALDRVIGGWQIGVYSRLQSGTPVDFGNVRLVGMTAKDVQNMFKLRFDNANKQVYMLPDDVIQNTILAFNVSATSPTGYAGAAPTGRYFAPANGPDCIEVTSTANAGGYGDCGVRSLVLNGPMFQQHDLRFSKRTTVVGHTNLEFAMEMLNAFNHPNFLAVAGTGANNPATITSYQVTGLQGQDTSRTIQFEFRFNW